MPSRESGGAAAADGCTVLIVYPGTVNYFYNRYARWMAEALRSRGASVELRLLSEVPPGSYDVCLLSNLCEIECASPPRVARALVRELRERCETLIACSADAVNTRWFRNTLEAASAVHADGICDLGFVRQDSQELRERGLRYHFCFDGLLGAQLPMGGEPETAADHRPIPWTHVAGRTLRRVELTDRLVREVSPGGFFYLPRPSPVTETGSPHLNEGQMERVLRRTRLYVWLSKHEGFFMESLRFRTAYLAGCVPVEVVDDAAEPPAGIPFCDLVIRESDIGARLRSLDFEHARQTFRHEYARHPRLEDGLVELLAAYGRIAPLDGDPAVPLEGGKELRACA